MSPSTIEWWAGSLTFLATLLAAFAAFIAFIALWFSSASGRLKAEELGRDKIESYARISEADAKEAEANKKAAQANERANQLELEASKLQKEAAEAKLEIMKLQEKLVWRIINVEQEERFISAVASAPKPKIQITYLTNDPETMNFAGQIGALLNKAGYDAPMRLADMSAVMPISGAMVGLVMNVKDESDISALALQQAFDLINIEAGGRVRPNQTSDIEIEIGQKLR